MFIDFAAIKEAVSILDVVKHFNLAVHATESAQLRCACPICKEGGERALVLTPAKGLFYCFAEKKGGDVIALTAHLKGIGVKDAARYLADTFTQPQPRKEDDVKATPTYYPPPPKKESAGFNPEEYSAKLDTGHDLVKKAGLSEELCQKVGIGVPSKGVHKGRLSFPLYDKAGNFICFASANDLMLPKQWRAT